MKNENLDGIYEVLESQEKEMVYEYHKDIETKKNTIKEAMNKIASLKLMGENLSDNLILLGDVVSLELDYGEEDLEIINQKLVITSNDFDELSLYSPIGSAVFAQCVGDMVNVKLPNGEVASVRIIAKNKNILDEDLEETYTR